MPIRYIPFFPDPIHGQALLNNFKRTLRYSDSEKAERLVRRGMPLHEIETTEQVGTDRSSGNLVIHGECLAACAALKNEGRTVDLVYIDPPFASGANYAKTIYLRRNPKLAEEEAAAEQTLQDDELASFEEKMYGDIWEKEKYLNWMYTNLLAIKSIMADNASIYVHLDWHIGHYVKVLMDEIFGEENFRNEIVWYYYNKMQGNVGHFAANHDVIFLYSKSSNIFFTPIKEKRDKVAKQIKRVWDSANERLVNAKDENGKVIYQETMDKTIDDVWRISMLQPADKTEPVDYATQKPEALLERIIKASSDKGMTVADFFGGSGVTAAVAQKLGRKFIHVDVGVNSIQTSRDRLVSLGASFDIREVKDGIALYRNPIQTMDKLKTLIPGFRNTSSLKDFWSGAIFDGRLGLVPVYLPNLLDSSSRCLDIPLLARAIHQAIPELPTEVKKVIIYYIQADDMDDIRKFIKEQKDTMVEIELRDLKNVLDEVIVNDEATWTLEKKLSEDILNPWLLTVTRFSSDCVQQKINEYNQKGNANPGKKGFTPIRISDEGLETIETIAADCSKDDKEPFHADRELKIDKYGHVILDGVPTGKLWNGTLTLPDKPRRLRFRNICGDESIFFVQ